MEQDKQEDTRHFIYLYPNLFTSAGIFAGFYSIVAAMNSSFSAAAIAIFVAAIMDALDGRVARMTNTQTHFGAEYDSLADIVSFGIAPALIVYKWALLTLGQVGWLVAFLFLAGAALRLAKFNSNLGKGSKRYFFGLPVPSAAAFIAGMVWIGHEGQVQSMTLAIFIAIAILYLAVMMVSNVKYRSFKDFDAKDKVGFTTIVVIVLLIAFVSLSPAYVLFIIFGLYALSGPVLLGWCAITGVDREAIEEAKTLEPQHPKNPDDHDEPVKKKYESNDDTHKKSDQS